jgi:hypothetical protein
MQRLGRAIPVSARTPALHLCSSHDLALLLDRREDPAVVLGVVAQITGWCREVGWERTATGSGANGRHEQTLPAAPCRRHAPSTAFQTAAQLGLGRPDGLCCNVCRWSQVICEKDQFASQAET